MTRLSYEEFRQFCLKSLEAMLDKEHYEAVFAQIRKNDEDVHDSIQFIEKDAKVGLIPSFRIKPFYQDYCDGQSLSDVMRRVLIAIEEAGSFTIDVDLNDFDQFDKIKDTLIIRPINYGRNRKLLENHLFTQVGDIALVLYNVMKSGSGIVATTKVPKKTALKWHPDADYLLKYALENTARMYPPYILPLERTLGGQKAIAKMPRRNKFFMNPLIKFQLLPSSMWTYFLSIEGGINGAIAAFYPGALERLAEIMDEDLYLSFTSVREAMVHKASEITADVIKEGARSNAENPYLDGEDEFLSQSAYMFSRDDNSLKIVR